MTENNELIPIENYYNLASAIAEVACADYVDAKIIALYGYLSLKKYRKQLYKAVISYGGGRYIRKIENKIIRQQEAINIRKCKNIMDMLDLKKRKEEGQYEAKRIEKFFLSDYFDVLMPNTDGRALLLLLNRRAKARKPLKSKYIN